MTDEVDAKGLTILLHNENRVAAALKSSPEVRLLRSIPGIGEILAPLVCLEIGEVNRFL